MQLSKKDWTEFIIDNCIDYYSLIVCSAILFLKELGFVELKVAEEKLKESFPKLDEFQIKSALKFVQEHTIEGIPEEVEDASKL
jgi:hypothetical protein